MAERQDDWLRSARSGKVSHTQAAVSRRLYGETADEQEELRAAQADARNAKRDLETAQAELRALKGVN